MKNNLEKLGNNTTQRLILEGSIFMQKKYIIGAVAGIIVLIAGFLLGYYIMRDPLYERIQSQPPPASSQSNSNGGAPLNMAQASLQHNAAVVDEGAAVQFITVYMSCGHQITKEELAPPDIVGLNEDQIAARYTGWRIDEFSPDKIVLIKEVDGYCPEHFVIKEHDGHVAVYKILGELVRDTEIPLDILPDIMQQQIKKGIIVNTEEEINSILENLDS